MDRLIFFKKSNKIFEDFERSCDALSNYLNSISYMIKEDSESFLYQIEEFFDSKENSNMDKLVLLEICEDQQNYFPRFLLHSSVCLLWSIFEDFMNSFVNALIETDGKKESSNLFQNHEREQSKLTLFLKKILPDYGIHHYIEEKLIDELYNIKKFRDDYTHNLKGYILSSDLDLKGIDRIVDCFTKVSEDKIDTVRKFVSELRSVLQT